MKGVRTQIKISTARFASQRRIDRSILLNALSLTWQRAR
jgi:hypothetical protein